MGKLKESRQRSPKYYPSGAPVVRKCKTHISDSQVEGQNGYVPTLNVAVHSLPTASTIRMPDIVKASKKE